MGLAGALLLVAGVVIAFANVVATRRLWASEIFERSQKVAQTVLMWLVPGSVIVVWNVLREPRMGNQPDPTAGGAATFMVTMTTTAASIPLAMAARITAATAATAVTVGASTVARADLRERSSPTSMNPA
jgi:hypothetical protein